MTAAAPRRRTGATGATSAAAASTAASRPASASKPGRDAAAGSLPPAGGAQRDGGVWVQRPGGEGAAGEEQGGVAGQVDGDGREVAHAAHARTTVEGEHARADGTRQPRHRAVAERGLSAADPERRAVELEHRVRVAGLDVGGQVAPLLRLRQPRLPGGARRGEPERRREAPPPPRPPAAGAARGAPAGCLPHPVLAELAGGGLPPPAGGPPARRPVRPSRTPP